MIALSIACIIVIALLCIINRRSAPGLANILYAILAASVLALVTFAFTSLTTLTTLHRIFVINSVNLYAQQISNAHCKVSFGWNQEFHSLVMVS